ncbi:hypothetical protein VSR68_40780 [Paraburkholderia phymatum]|uniref:hypothetical protein n=1 Tax=Paraburkholderia phymatum TaxID=148447 RepID=UPI00316C6388
MELQIALPDSFPLQGGERDAFEEKVRAEKIDALRPYQLSDLLPLRRIGDGHVLMDATNRLATTTLPAPGRAGAGLLPALSHQAQQRQVLTTVDNGIEVDTGVVCGASSDGCLDVACANVRDQAGSVPGDGDCTGSRFRSSCTPQRRDRTDGDPESFFYQLASAIF